MSFSILLKKIIDVCCLHPSGFAKITGSSTNKVWVGMMVLLEVMQLLLTCSTKIVICLLRDFSSMQNKRGYKWSSYLTLIEQLKI